MTDKSDSLLGFARKAGKIIYGADNLDRRVRLVILSAAASESVTKRALTFGERNHIKVVKSDKPLDEILFINNCMAIGLKDRKMSEAILLFIKNEESKYRIVSEV